MRNSPLQIKYNPGINRGLKRVADGARTRDLLDHNQALCQLSYSHHVHYLQQQ